MDALARTMPGFIDVKAFTAEDGERLTVVWWETKRRSRRGARRPATAWRSGRAASAGTRDYKMDVAEVVRSKTFKRDSVGLRVGDRVSGRLVADSLNGLMLWLKS